jgi:hypothetical protein
MGEQTSDKNTVEFEAWVYQKTRFWPQLPDYLSSGEHAGQFIFPISFFIPPSKTAGENLPFVANLNTQVRLIHSKIL